MRKELIAKHMSILEKDYNSPKFFEFHWEKAFCFILLGDNISAKENFRISFLSMLKPPMFWWKSGQPNRLIDIYILSNVTNKKEELMKVWLEYSTNLQTNKSLVYYQAYGILGLCFPELDSIEISVKKLLAKEKVKDTFIIGKCIEAISQKNLVLLEELIYDLLEVHKRMATKGSYRGVIEGWLCSPAMVLTIVAYRLGLEFRIKHEYFSQEYLDYLLIQNS